jgi:hypothetical protein
MNSNNTSQQTEKKKVHRSPNYPAFSLKDAIEKVRTIYQHEKRASTTADVILHHLGFRPGSGGGYRAISALRQYGLLEEQDGKNRLSDQAFLLINYPEGSAERDTILRRAALKPSIFADILKEYVENPPSDVTLRSYLLREKNFNPAAVEDFIKIFKETISIAKVYEMDYSTVPESEFIGGSSLMEPGSSVVPAIKTEQLPPSSEVSVLPNVHVYSWPLSIPRNVRAELRVFGRDFRKEDVQRLKKQLELLEEAFSDGESRD